MWVDKFAITLAAIAAIVAAILAPELSAYPTVVETVGAAVGLFIGIGAVFVLPLWLILRITAWVTGVLGARQARA